MYDTDRPAFTEPEIQLIEATGGSVEVLVRPIESCPDLDAAWDGLTWCLQLHQKAESLAIKSRYAIGKFLLLARDNPDLYRRHGYSTYSSFIKEYVCRLMGLGRTSLYQARSWAEKLSSIGPEMLEELGPTKALILTTYSQDTDPSFPIYLEEAQKRTPQELEKWAVERGMIESGDIHTTAIIVRSTQTVANQWAQFKADPAVHERVGSSSEFLILEALMQEASTWFGDPQRQEPCPHCEGTGRDLHRG